MQFRLIYRGPLKAQSQNARRPKEKHAIRRVIRPQLEELWKTHPFLKHFLRPHIRRQYINPHVSAPTIEELNEKMHVTEYDDFSSAQNMAKRYAHKGYNFLPLVGSDIF